MGDHRPSSSTTAWPPEPHGVVGKQIFIKERQPSHRSASRALSSQQSSRSRVEPHGDLFAAFGSVRERVRNLAPARKNVPNVIPLDRVSELTHRSSRGSSSGTRQSLNDVNLPGQVPTHGGRKAPKRCRSAPAKRAGGGPLCGATCADGHACQNARGMCPHHSGQKKAKRAARR